MSSKILITATVAILGTAYFWWQKNSNYTHEGENELLFNQLKESILQENFSQATEIAKQILRVDPTCMESYFSLIWFEKENNWHEIAKLHAKTATQAKIIEILTVKIVNEEQRHWIEENLLQIGSKLTAFYLACKHNEKSMFFLKKSAD